MASRAIRDFVKSPDFGRLVDGRLELFKASPELERIVEGRVEQFKSSEAFEELVNQRLDTYQDSIEFEELQLSLMKSVGEQILDRFRRKRPDVDLSFLDESDNEDVEVVEPYLVAGDEGQPQEDASRERSALRWHRRKAPRAEKAGMEAPSDGGFVFLFLLFVFLG